MSLKTDYPSWVCVECGERYGKRLPTVATWHKGICGVCYREVPVTEPRDFGHLTNFSAHETNEKNNFPK